MVGIVTFSGSPMLKVTYTNCHGFERRRLILAKIVFRWEGLCDFLRTKAVREKRDWRYVYCSGQGSGSRRWSVYDRLKPAWRPLNAKGNVVLYASCDAAAAAANKFNATNGYPEFPHTNRGW